MAKVNRGTHMLVEVKAVQRANDLCDRLKTDPDPYARILSIGYEKALKDLDLRREDAADD